MTAFFLRRKDDRSQTQASTAKELPNQCGHALAIFSSGFVLFSASTERKCLGGELDFFLHHMGVQMKRLDGLLYHGLMEGGAYWLRIHFCLCVVQSHKTMVRTTSLPDMRKLLQYKAILVYNKFIGAALHCSWCLGISVLLSFEVHFYMGRPWLSRVGTYA